MLRHQTSLGRNPLDLPPRVVVRVAVEFRDYSASRLIDPGQQLVFFTQEKRRVERTIFHQGLLHFENTSIERQKDKLAH